MLSVNAMASLSNSKLSFQFYYYYYYYYYKHSEKCSNKLLTPRKDLQIKASSSVAPDVDLKTLESAISKKDSDAIKEALDQLSEVGWSKKWSSQPYVSCLGYLLGLPILGYSLDIGKEHVNPIDEKLEKLIYSGQLDAKELDRWAVVAMTGLAAEGLKYDKVVGQSADLFTLQRFINRSKPKLSNDQQQNLIRWAVLFAGSLLKNTKVTYEALMSVMSKKATVLECSEAIEKAA